MAENSLWEDREVRFDLSLVQMKTRPGEKIIDKLDFIEDTKGNAGDKGRLVITSLRLMWNSLSVLRINLSIGLACIQQVSTKVINSRLRGTAEALHILTKSSQSRFEFIFTNLVPGAIVRRKELKMLPREHIYSQYQGVWNLSSDQGNLGVFMATNIRVVWYADMNESFNISLPYIQIASIRLRESKFGLALVIESYEQSGGYVLGFRIDPQETMQTVCKELQSYHRIHTTTPEYGVDYVVSDVAILAEEAPVVQEDIAELEEDDNMLDLSNTLTLYSADHMGGGTASANRTLVFSPELGLCVEQPKPGFTMARLWEVIPSSGNHANQATTLQDQ
ncbi:hypothetical protein M8J76_012478 [Diaphorina citri]|nr:hypothetical protein M8J76_012478 [Diaphorina citri]